MLELKKKIKSKDTRYYYFYILFALCIGILSIMMSYGINGNDFWWHVKSGEWIVENKTFPREGIFSWMAMDKHLKWYAHEWLSQIVYYGIYSLGGQYAIYVFCFATGTLMLYLIYKVSKEYVLNNITYSALIFIFTMIVIKNYFFGRPQIFSFFLVFTELKFLYDYINNKDNKEIYFIPLLGVIWVNMHGGSSNLSYLLCLFFLIAGVINFKFGKISFERLPKNKLLTISGVMLATIIAVFINPYGLDMVLYPYTNMADNLMLDLIFEWRAPDAKNIAILLFFFVPFALGLISIITTEKKIRGIDLFIFAFFSYMFFRSTRFIVMLVVSYPFYIFNYIPKFGTLNEVKSRADKIVATVLIAAGIGMTVFGLVNGVNTYSKGKLIDHELDYKFVELMKEEKPERPYTEYNYGGDLIYYGIDVLVDGRADVYTGTPLEDWNNLTKLTIYSAPNKEYDKHTFVEDIINKYKFDAYLVDVNRPLYQYLLTNSDRFELVKENKETAYFRVIK